MNDLATLAAAAAAERDRRAELYPAKIAAGADPEPLTLDYQCWVAIAEWLATDRFASFAGGVEPESDNAPIIRWPELERAAGKALDRVTAKIDAMEADPGQEAVEADKRLGPAERSWKLAGLRERRGILTAIHRKLRLRREIIDGINIDLRARAASGKELAA